MLAGFTGALLAAALLAVQRAPPPDAAGARPDALAALQGALERARLRSLSALGFTLNPTLGSPRVFCCFYAAGVRLRRGLPAVYFRPCLEP